MKTTLTSTSSHSFLFKYLKIFNIISPLLAESLAARILLLKLLTAQPITEKTPAYLFLLFYLIV